MSPSQSPSSMYSHAPTVIHHSAHRSALARRATRQLSKWTESPTSTHDHHSNHSSPHAPVRAADYSYNGNYNTEYTARRKSQGLTQSPYSPYQGLDDDRHDGDDEHVSTVQSGPTVRKYADLNFDDEDEDDAIGFAQIGRREKIGGEWGTPESALAGIGRQATRMMRAATTKKGSGGKDVGVGLGLGIGGMLGGGSYARDDRKGKESGNVSPSTSVASRGSGRQRLGDLLSTSSRKPTRERDFLTSGSKVSIASDQSRETATTRTSSSESSVGEAVITPNHSSAFTPYHDRDHSFNTAVKYTYPTRSATTSAQQYAERATGHTPTLAPSARIYDPATNTNSNTVNLSPAAFALSPTPANFAASDRPLMSSGSPGFGLISLEVAQERERVRLGGPTPKSSGTKKGKDQTTPRLPAVPTLPATQSQKIKNKKSLISLFRSATAYASGSSGPAGPAPPVPGFSMVNTSAGGKKMNIGEPMPLMLPHEGMATPSARDPPEQWPSAPRESREDARPPMRDDRPPQASRTLLPGPKLELRPVSMMLANGLPEDYLASSSTSELDDSQDGRSSVFTATESLSSTSSLLEDPDASDPSAHPEVLALRKELANLKKTHQYQQSELSSQLREMKDQLSATQAEMEEVRADKQRWAPREDGCTECGCTCGMAVSEMLMGSAPSPRLASGAGTVMGRARSGTTSRSVRSVRSTKSTTSGRADYSGIPVPAVPIPERTPGGGGGRGVMDRGRVKTGGARGVFGTGSLYEWE
ncbi:uncharacterized protein MKK02DRAFT_42689 [Dioszegia hungarica]|uniref:Uncharacterized protein n=1 Tax=Dioszegia hungarica TaxID=4972 RepID=A0AA38HDA4_9TREE|nr:uncharacterized protein MKK02DRAFT_42689 [Dioszegia hungarica]KAI9638301.1 hypothetical protein MKK02DRAFT_42689 [Dioszegia hungarica]